MSIHCYITIFDVLIQLKCASIQYHRLMYHDMAIYTVNLVRTIFMTDVVVVYYGCQFYSSATV